MGQCQQCGTPTSPEHSFCLNCGVELPTEVEEIRPFVDAELPPVPRPAAEAPRVPPIRARSSGKPRRPRGLTGPRTLPAIVALVLSLLLQQLINSVVPAEAYLHRLFRPQGGWVMSVVPALIAFVFIWTLTDLILKLRVARVNEADLARPAVGQIAGLVRQEPTQELLRRLRGWSAAELARPVGRRLAWLFQHLDTVDAQRAHELTRHQSDLDSDTAASGYRTVRLFIWAMPILGFIGTVLGISLAVGSFSEFLTTDVSIDEIDRVTAELGNVASGLSFAFDTTLLGLLAGLVASVASSGVQSKEERFLTGLEELGLRIMESARPAESAATVASAVPVGSAPAEEFDRMMRVRLQELSGQMRRFTQSVQTGLDGFLTEWGKLPPEVEKVAADLAGLREHLSSAAKSTERLVLETRQLLEGLNEASMNMSDGVTASIGSVRQTVDGLGSSLGGISNMLESSLEAIERNRRDDEAANAALERLSASIAELGASLQEFKETQSAMVPLLSQLSGPLELRLMPTPTASPQQK